MTAKDALTTIKKKRDVCPSGENLAMLARIHNRAHADGREPEDAGDVAMDGIRANFKKHVHKK